MGEEKGEVLEDVLKETVDLESIPIEEVLKNLRCTKEGLTSSAAQERLAIFGHNKKKESKFLKFLGFMWNPLSWVMEAAVIMAIALVSGGWLIRKHSDHPHDKITEHCIKKKLRCG